MTSRRLYWTLLSLVCLLIVGLLGGTFFINQQLHAKADALNQQRQQIAVLDGRQTALTSAKADVQKYQDLAKIAKSIVPQDKDQAQTVREIVKLANKDGVDLGSFSFPASTLGTTGVTGTSTGKITHNPDLSQLIPVKGIAGVLSLQVIVQSDTKHPASYNSFLKFLRDLEQNRRTAQVTSITITPDAQNSANIGFTLTLEEYIKP